MEITVHVYTHAAPPQAELASILRALEQLKQEIATMSENLSSDIDAATAKLETDLATISAGVTELQTELATALAGVTPGSTVTQAQVTALQGIVTSMDALAASVPATPPAG